MKTKCIVLISCCISFTFQCLAQQFDDDNGINIHTPGVKTAYRKNIISFSPLNFIALKDHFFESKPRAAVSFSYERIFKDQHISVKFPVNVLLSKPGFYLMPAIKLYPKKQRILKYAIGPQFLFSRISDYIPSYLTLVGAKYLQTRLQLGVGLSNSLNLSFSKKFYAGLEAGFGFLYYDSFYYNHKKEYGSPGAKFSDPNLPQTINMGLNAGYRF